MPTEIPLLAAFQLVPPSVDRYTPPTLLPARSAPDPLGSTSTVGTVLPASRPDAANVHGDWSAHDGGGGGGGGVVVVVVPVVVVVGGVVVDVVDVVDVVVVVGGVVVEVV